MSTKPAVLVSADNDDDRRTNRRLGSLPREERAAAARCFIGFDVVIEFVPNAYRDACTAHIEGVGMVHGGEWSHYLVVTETPNKHDLSRMELYALNTIRSIKTVTQ